MESSSTSSTTATTPNTTATVYSSSIATYSVTPTTAVKSSSSSSMVAAHERRYKSTSCLFPNADNTSSPNFDNSVSTISSCYNSSGISEFSSPTTSSWQPPLASISNVSHVQSVFSPISTASYVPTHSSAYLTTPTSSLSMITSPSPFPMTRTSPAVLSGSVPSVSTNQSPDLLTHQFSPLPAHTHIEKDSIFLIVTVNHDLFCLTDFRTSIICTYHSLPPTSCHP